MNSKPLSWCNRPQPSVFVRIAAVHNCLVVIDANALVCSDSSYAARSAADATSNSSGIVNVGRWSA